MARASSALFSQLLFTLVRRQNPKYPGINVQTSVRVRVLALSRRLTDLDGREGAVSLFLTLALKGRTEEAIYR